jgi:hypothetical protein
MEIPWRRDAENVPAQAKRGRRWGLLDLDAAPM